MATPKTLLAVYDMDKTITRRPTLTPFLRHAVQTRGRWRILLTPFALVAVALFVVRIIGRARLKEINHRLFLGARLRPSVANALAREFARITAETDISEQAKANIEKDRREGRRLVMATASYGFYAREIAEALVFDDVIATEAMTNGAGDILPRISGENCYGAAKRRQFDAWLVSSGLRREDCHIRFYSDHVSDRPMFEGADEAVAVNAHAPLITLARVRGWACVNWV